MTGPAGSTGHPGRPWTATADGLVVTVRVTPRGGRDAIGGVSVRDDGQPVLLMKVRAAPSEGEANAAVIALLARALKVPPRDVTLVAGQTARIKRLAVRGEAAALTARLEEIAKSA